MKKFTENEIKNTHNNSTSVSHLLTRVKHLRGRHDQLDHAWNRGMGQGGYGAGLAPNQMGPLPTENFYRKRLTDLTEQRRRGEITRAEMRRQMRDLRGITTGEANTLVLANTDKPKKYEAKFGTPSDLAPRPIDASEFEPGGLLEKIIKDRIGDFSKNIKSTDLQLSIMHNQIGKFTGIFDKLIKNGTNYNIGISSSSAIVTDYAIKKLAQEYVKSLSDQDKKFLNKNVDNLNHARNFYKNLNYNESNIFNNNILDPSRGSPEFLEKQFFNMMVYTLEDTLRWWLNGDNSDIHNSNARNIIYNEENLNKFLESYFENYLISNDDDDARLSKFEKDLLNIFQGKNGEVWNKNGLKNFAEGAIQYETDLRELYDSFQNRNNYDMSVISKSKFVDTFKYLLQKAFEKNQDNWRNIFTLEGFNIPGTTMKHPYDFANGFLSREEKNDDTISNIDQIKNSLGTATQYTSSKDIEDKIQLLKDFKTQADPSILPTINRDIEELTQINNGPMQFYIDKSKLLVEKLKEIVKENEKMAIEIANDKLQNAIYNSFASKPMYYDPLYLYNDSYADRGGRSINTTVQEYLRLHAASEKLEKNNTLLELVSIYENILESNDATGILSRGILEWFNGNISSLSFDPYILKSDRNQFYDNVQLKLELLYEMQGFNGKPQTVSIDEILNPTTDVLLDSDKNPLVFYRSVTGKNIKFTKPNEDDGMNFINEMRNGERHYPGIGVSGYGTYMKTQNLFNNGVDETLVDLSKGLTEQQFQSHLKAYDNLDDSLSSLQKLLSKDLNIPEFSLQDETLNKQLLQQNLNTIKRMKEYFSDNFNNDYLTYRDNYYKVPDFNGLYFYEEDVWNLVRLTRGINSAMQFNIDSNISDKSIKTIIETRDLMGKIESELGLLTRRSYDTRQEVQEAIIKNIRKAYGQYTAAYTVNANARVPKFIVNQNHTGPSGFDIGIESDDIINNEFKKRYPNFDFQGFYDLGLIMTMLGWDMYFAHPGSYSTNAVILNRGILNMGDVIAKPGEDISMITEK